MHTHAKFTLVVSFLQQHIMSFCILVSRIELMRVLAFAATSSKNSINKALVRHAGQVLKKNINPNAEVEIIDLNDFEMPIYSIDREKEDGIPTLARAFFEKITHADALIISYAEHNGFYTAAYKNIFDWASRIQMKVFQDKPMVIMSSSVGPNGGANVLKVAEQSAPFFGATIKGSFSVGSFEQKFNRQQGQLNDATLSQTLITSLQTLNEIFIEEKT